jgi:D-serine deaminase-like pyridoxal phosphate-dependent protein
MGARIQNLAQSANTGRIQFEKLMRFNQLSTPAALVDMPRMQRNIQRMQARMNALRVRFRPHVKTTKCMDIVREQIAAGAQGITVSTLKEAEQFFAAGITDILYAVGMVPHKLPQAMALLNAGCALKLVVDNVPAAQAIAAAKSLASKPIDVFIEVDTDGHRSGIEPDDPQLIEIAHALEYNAPYNTARLAGVMTHAGASYALNTPTALEAMAEQERTRCVRAAEHLRAAGFACPEVSVGSTPTALSAARLPGVTEVRAGVYVFFDLVMSNVGVCTPDDIALSVLTTVIGHREDKGWAIVDAGWMAMSRDRGTEKQLTDYGYGQVCATTGEVHAGYTIQQANQEHGIVALRQGIDTEIAKRFPVGSQLRVLPNHACATGAQFPEYVAISAGGLKLTWPRFYGW